MDGETKTSPVPPNPGTDLAPPDVIRTETVLSKLPIHNLTKRERVDIQITKTSQNGEVELKWEVSYNDRYGQARQLAYKLDTIVVDQAIEEAGKPLPQRLRLGSLRDISEQLGASEGGRALNGLRRAFRQNAFAGITAKFKYKANDGTERTLEASFTRYSVIFTGEKFTDGSKADAVYIELNPIFREVLNNAPFRPLDLDYKKQLTPTAQRFYEIVSYKIFAAIKYNQPFARLAYSEYCTFSAQQRYFDYDHFKKQMYKVHRPHVTSGYLAHKPHYENTTDQEGKPDWIMCYVPGPKARAEYATFTSRKDQTIVVRPKQHLATATQPRRPRQPNLNLYPEVNPEHLAELTTRGVSEAAARRELATLPPDFPLLDTLEWGDFQVASSGGKITNPPGLHISLLRDRLTPPAGFVSSRAREAQEEATTRKRQAILEAQAKLLAEEQAAEEQAEAKLDRLAAQDPARYKVLFDQAKGRLIAQHPVIAAAFKLHPDSSVHDGAIRSMMKTLGESTL